MKCTRLAFALFLANSRSPAQPPSKVFTFVLGFALVLLAFAPVAFFPLLGALLAF